MEAINTNDAKPVKLVKTLPLPSDRYRDKPTRMNAMDAKCQDCVNGPDEKGWRGEIRHCAVTSCPLWVFRPYK